MNRSEQGGDRRKHAQDRRSGTERRNSVRHSHDSFDCRSGSPRRESDLMSEPAVGEIYWDHAVTP